MSIGNFSSDLKLFLKASLFKNIIYPIRHRSCIISVFVRSKSLLVEVESKAEDDAANIPNEDSGFDKSNEGSIRREGVKNRRWKFGKICCRASFCRAIC